MNSDKSFSVIAEKQDKTAKPSRLEAEAAVRTLIRWAGDDPEREGLIDTPKRVVKAFKEYFKGYKEDPIQVLDKTFGDVDGYDDMVIQKNTVSYTHLTLPTKRIV